MVFLKISQNSQEKSCVGVSFLIKLQASDGCFCTELMQKKTLFRRVFLLNKNRVEGFSRP